MFGCIDIINWCHWFICGHNWNRGFFLFVFTLGWYPSLYNTLGLFEKSIKFVLLKLRAFSGIIFRRTDKSIFHVMHFREIMNYWFLIRIIIFKEIGEKFILTVLPRPGRQTLILIIRTKLYSKIVFRTWHMRMNQIIFQSSVLFVALFR